MTDAPSKKAVILAVDDTPENLDVVKGILSHEYTLRAAVNGKMALKIAASQLPDIILLDIMMPEMDGYEVCKRLKADPKTADIPIIFLTAKGQTEDEAKGLALGACDYIMKPVSPPILEARVKTHLALKKNMDALQKTSAELSAAKEKMEDELNVGKRIQLSMLPPTQLDENAFKIAALMRAALQVGGDLYDYFPISPREFCLCIADVSDKGVPASLFMAVTKTLVRASASEDSSTASIVTRINDELARDNESCMFVTMFLAICDIQTGEVRYTNAGHNPPFLKRVDGQAQQITEMHGPVVGAVDGLTYGESTLQLNTGDLLFLYTDGVSEAMNGNDDLFLESKIGECLSALEVNDPQQSIDTIIHEVDEFCSGCDQSDDITMLAFRLDVDQSSLAQRNLELQLINDLAEIDRLNDSFNEFAEEIGVPMSISLKTNMVFDELLNNIISYAYDDDEEHEILIKVDSDGSRIVITIEDDGIPFNPLMKDDPDTTSELDDREIGGLGIYLVKNVMDDVIYKRQMNCNQLTLVKQFSN